MHRCFSFPLIDLKMGWVVNSHFPIQMANEDDSGDSGKTLTSAMLFEIPALIGKLVSFINSSFDARTGFVLRSNANAGLNCPRCLKFHMRPRCNNHLPVA